MAVVWACFALPILCLFNLSLMTYIKAVHILWTPLYFKHLCIIRTSLHRIDTSPYCGHLSIMNAICILWTPFHYECNMYTMDTSPYCGHLSILWTPLHAYYGHLSIMNAICILSTPLHRVDTSTLWMQCAYYGHLSILWIPLNYEHNMHTIDTSAFFISQTVDSFAYKSLLHTPLHKLWTPLHIKETYAQYGPLSHLCILQSTPMHTCTMDTYA